MPTAISGGSRIRTNIQAENAYNALNKAGNNIAKSQLRLSTGKRINNASDDVAGYITSRSLQSRNGALKSAMQSTGDAKNVTSITQDSLDNINGLLTTIKDSAATASSGSLGTDEKVALAKGAYRLAQQIQFVVDSTVFGGKQLLQGDFQGEWTIGYYADNTVLSIDLNLKTDNSDFNVDSQNFNLNATASARAGVTSTFAGVEGLNLEALNSVSADELGIFSNDQINTTLTSLATALNNVNKVASYIGGVEIRLNSQEDLLQSQMTNYSAAISRIEDTDVAKEQLDLIKSQFLQQASVISLAQANQNPQTFLQLMG